VLRCCVEMLCWDALLRCCLEMLSWDFVLRCCVAYLYELKLVLRRLKHTMVNLFACFEFDHFHQIAISIAIPWTYYVYFDLFLHFQELVTIPGCHVVTRSGKACAVLPDRLILFGGMEFGPHGISSSWSLWSGPDVSKIVSKSPPIQIYSLPTGAARPLLTYHYSMQVGALR